MSYHQSEIQETGKWKLYSTELYLFLKKILIDIISNDSDIDCSQSVCSDTHSDNTSASGLTDKSTISDSTIHAPSGSSETDNKVIQGPVTTGG